MWEDFSKMENVYAFYKDATVLITGGTGFMGKVLVEKLLRCFDVKCVILLVRSKNNVEPDVRLAEYIKESIFQKLHESTPNIFKTKLIAMNVDYNADDLGIDGKHLQTIINEVQIVFNAVASVKFNEKLKDAININILYTKRVVDLTEQMKNLKAFIHVSTFFSQCHLEYIPELINVPNINCEQLLEMTNGQTTEDVEKLSVSLMQDMPNTYTLTKRYAEELVSKLANRLPAGIFRPPILCSTYKEPMQGWTDNLYGPMAFGVGVAKGFIHAVQLDENMSMNALPVDYCINALVATAWDVNCSNAQRTGSIPVYNYLFSENNPTWKEHIELIPRGFHEPLNQPLWHFFIISCTNNYLYLITSFMLHTVPGFILDCLRVLSGQEKLFIKGYQKLNRLTSMTKFFAVRQWKYQNDNIVKLDHKLKQQGIDGLEFDGRTIDWANGFYPNFIPGLKKYFFKESLDKVEQLRTQYKRLKYLHYTVLFCFWMGILLILYSLFVVFF